MGKTGRVEMALCVCVFRLSGVGVGFVGPMGRMGLWVLWDLCVLCVLWDLSGEQGRRGIVDSGAPVGDQDKGICFSCWGFAVLGFPQFRVW